MTRLLLSLAALCVALSPGVARAESSVLVLSVRALDGNDALAARLSDALRVAADEVDGWSVSDREVSLAQMSLAHGCEGTTATCMADIAKTLEVDRLIYGTSQGQDEGVALNLHNFDAVTGHVEGSYEDVVTPDSLAEGAVQRTARTIAMHLAGMPPTGSIMVTSNLAEGQVLLDGKSMGPLEGPGELLLEDVGVGSHVVGVQSSGQQEQLEVEVLIGETAMAHLELVPPAPPEPVALPAEPPPTEPEPRKGLRVAGWVLVGTAGALLAATSGVWGRMQGINNDPDMQDYRDMFPSTTPDVCVQARMGEGGDGTRPGIDERVAELCDAGEALEKAQWGLLAGTIASAVVGTTLLVVARKKERATQVALLPRVSLREAGLEARLSF